MILKKYVNAWGVSTTASAMLKISFCVSIFRKKVNQHHFYDLGISSNPYGLEGIPLDTLIEHITDLFS